MGTFWSLVCCKEEAVPKPPGRQVGLIGEQAGLPPPTPKKAKKTQNNTQLPKAAGLRKKWPCDFPSKGEKGKDEIIFAQRKGRLVPLPKNYGEAFICLSREGWSSWVPSLPQHQKVR